MDSTRAASAEFSTFQRPTCHEYQTSLFSTWLALYSEQLLLRQLTLLGKVAHIQAASPLKRDTLVPGTLQAQVARSVRRIGRPRQNWTEELLKIGTERLGVERLRARKGDGEMH